MPTADDLKRSWTHAPSDLIEAEGLELYHPAFTNGASGRYGFTNHSEAFEGTVAGAGYKLLFQPYPFKCSLPSKDGSGRQDMSINLAIDTGEMRKELRRALEWRWDEAPVPIRAQLCTYLVHPGAPTGWGGAFVAASDPITLSLGAVELKGDTLSGVANRADIVNRAFPRMVYRATDFPGLVR